MDVIQAIAQRRSHRAFQSKPVEEEKLEALLNAALLSPSARNIQPCHITLTTSQGLLNQVNEAAREAALRQPNPSPRFQDEAFHIFYHAPAVIFLSSDLGHYARIDAGIMVQTLALAAEGLGLGSVILGLPGMAFEGGQKAALEQALSFPENKHFTIAIAVGYPSDTKEAHDLRPQNISRVV